MARQKKEKQTAQDEKRYDTIRKLVYDVCKDAIHDEARKIADARMQNLIAQLPPENSPLRKDKIYCRFTSEQLLRIFGGWFTCHYLFTVKNGTFNKDGEEEETDYWICSQDVSGMRVNERPPRNEAVFKRFGVEVNGFAIIAPQSAF